MCFLSSGNFGFALASSNAAMPAIRYQLDWPDDKVDLYTTIVSSSSVAGIAFGSVIGGVLIANGRKRMVALFDVVGMVGCGLSVVSNMYVLCLGRFVYGFAAGVFVCASSKVIDETVPGHLLDNGFSISTNLSISVYITISMVLGWFVPDSTDELETTQMWRVVYLAPIPLLLIALLMNLTHKGDSLMFHVH